MAQATFEQFEREAASPDVLTDAEREVYELVSWDDKEPSQAAFETGRKASTARTLLMRARRKLGETPDGGSEWH